MWRIKKILYFKFIKRIRFLYQEIQRTYFLKQIIELQHQHEICQQHHQHTPLLCHVIEQRIQIIENINKYLLKLLSILINY